MRTLLLLLCLVALPTQAATLSTTTCTSTVKTGCVVMDLSTLNQLPSTVGVQLSGTWVGTVVFEGSLNGTTYVSVKADPSGSGSWASEATSNGIWGADVAAMKFFRVRASVLSSGTITVDLVPTTARRMVDLVRAVGSTFGPLDATGTFNLSNSSLGALGTEYCVTREGERRWVLGTAPTLMPPNLPDGGSDPLRDRTRLTVWNYSSNHTVSCWPDPGDGGVPDCDPGGVGKYVATTFGEEGFLLEPGTLVRCRSCTGTAETYTEEQACTAP